MTAATEPRTIRIWSTLGIALVAVLVAVSIFLLTTKGRGTVPNDAAPQPAQDAAIGEEVVLHNEKGSIVVALDSWSFDKYIRLAVLKDKEGLRQMFKVGLLVAVPSGTPARLTAIPNYGTRGIEILDGEKKGRNGVVAMERVTR
jgi:hypothetical protein